MRHTLLIIVFSTALYGCSGNRIKSFNDGTYSDSDLITITTNQDDTFFGNSIKFLRLDGNPTYHLFTEMPPTTIKVTPGKHRVQISYMNRSFSLNNGNQYLKLSFNIDAIKNHKYKVFYMAEHTDEQKLESGKKYGSWIEDLTTGNRLPLQCSKLDY